MCARSVLRDDVDFFSSYAFSTMLPCRKDIYVKKLSFWKMGKTYSIIKDSSADLGVNSKIVQIRPTVKAVSTKISKKILHICQYFDISERK